MKPQDKIIVAFDVHTKDQFLNLAKSLEGEAQYIKIGMECFYSLGSDSVSLAKDFGFKVFLDLKLHDIPNTVEKSCYALAKLGADMLNVHALGGLEMMKAAKQGIERGGHNNVPKLIAVTHLTSLNQMILESQIGISKDLIESTTDLALLAKKANLDGVVSSALEVEKVKSTCAHDFFTVTPGIRLANSDRQDQKRVVTPKETIKLGSDYIVIGRYITLSNNPRETFIKILEEIK